MNQLKEWLSVIVLGASVIATTAVSNYRINENGKDIAALQTADTGQANAIAELKRRDDNTNALVTLESTKLQAAIKATESLLTNQLNLLSMTVERLDER